jgi:hypothetical protein
MLWTAIAAVAGLVSMIAYILTLLYIRAELKAVEKDRYLTVTNELFALWQSKDFMDAQLWLLHRLQETTWPDFVRAHRGGDGEAAFYRVGAFYNRIGTLVRLGLINQDEILSSVGAHAIGVWQKIHGLVEEVRRHEHSTLFSDFERLLPACLECYVPSLGAQGLMQPFALTQPVARISPHRLKERLDRGEPLTIIDVRRAEQVTLDPRKVPGARWIPAEDIAQRATELPREQETIFYCA